MKKPIYILIEIHPVDGCADPSCIRHHPYLAHSLFMNECRMIEAEIEDELINENTPTYGGPQ